MFSFETSSLSANREQVAEMFRTLRTILFLCRLCQGGVEESIVLLGSGLHPDRMATLVNIALNAESQLASHPDSDRMRAHPSSWQTSCATVPGPSMKPPCNFGSAFSSHPVLKTPTIPIKSWSTCSSSSTPTQSRIFNFGCQQALNLVPGHVHSSADPITVGLKQMIELTNEHDLNRAKTDVSYLYNLGLIRKAFDFTSYQDVENFDVTPSDLGIELSSKHCHGSREKLSQGFVDSANSHLANFIPPPQSLAAFDPNNRTSMPTYVPD